MKIQITQQNLEALRAAKSVARHPYAWPGGYQRFLVMDDGGCLCPACVKKEYRHIVAAALLKAYRGGWYPAASDINWEDADLLCDHCGQSIPCAYGEA